MCRKDPFLQWFDYLCNLRMFLADSLFCPKAECIGPRRAHVKMGQNSRKSQNSSVCKRYISRKVIKIKLCFQNKLASLNAMLVWNSAEPVTDQTDQCRVENSKCSIYFQNLLAKMASFIKWTRPKMSLWMINDYHSYVNTLALKSAQLLEVKPFA